MYSPLPDDWEDLIVTGFTPKAVMDVIPDPFTGQITLEDIPIEKWSLTVDRRSDIRRTANATIVDADLLTALKAGTSGLEPYGTEVRIRIGYSRPDGSSAFVMAGYFQIEELEWNEDETAFSMVLNDRGKSLQRSSFGIPLDASGKLITTFINDILYEAIPYAQLVIDDEIEDIRLPGGTSYRSGILSSALEAAQALGADFFFDSDGVARLVPVPYIDTINGPGNEDWTITSGETGVMVSYQRKVSRDGSFNKVHVYGAPKNGDTPQPYASAQDDNPASPTYYGGRFGKADVRIERQELTSEGQCLEYARAYLRNSIGLSKSIELKSLMNPALDVGDIILVTYPDATNEFHLVDKITMDQSGGMSISTRSEQEPQ